MASLLWNDIREISRDEAKQSILLLLDDVGFGATAWQPFSTPSLMVELSAEMRADLSRYCVILKNSFMADTATDEALTQLSRSFYANERELAVTSQLLITLTCDVGSGPHPIDLGELTFVHEDGATFRNVDGNSITYPYSLTSGSSVTLLCEAEVAGAAGNITDALSVELVTIQLQTTLSGVSVTAHVIDRSGVDEESDDRLRERNQLKWSLLSRLMLIDEGVMAEALNVAPAVLSVGVDSTNPRGQGTFDVYIAGLDSAAGAEDVSAVQIALDRLTFGRKNTPKTVKVYASPEQALDITAMILFNGTSTTTQVATAVEAALIQFIRDTPVGGWSYLPSYTHTVRMNDIESVIRTAVFNLGATKCTVQLTTPSSDIAVGTYGKVIQGVFNLTCVPIIE